MHENKEERAINVDHDQWWNSRLRYLDLKILFGPKDVEAGICFKISKITSSMQSWKIETLK